MARPHHSSKMTKARRLLPELKPTQLYLRAHLRCPGLAALKGCSSVSSLFSLPLPHSLKSKPLLHCGKSFLSPLQEASCLSPVTTHPLCRPRFMGHFQRRMSPPFASIKGDSCKRVNRAQWAEQRSDRVLDLQCNRLKHLLSLTFRRPGRKEGKAGQTPNPTESQISSVQLLSRVRLSVTA